MLVKVAVHKLELWWWRLGKEAKRIHEEALIKLKKLISEKKLKGNAIVGLYPANSAGDDIEIYKDEDRKEVVAKFHGLRQQEEKVCFFPAL